MAPSCSPSWSRRRDRLLVDTLHDGDERAAVDVVFAVLAREAALLTDEGPEAYEPSPGYDAAYAELVDDLGIGASAIPFLTKWYGRSPR
ncbi:MAG: hypothetical protein JWO74_1062 [Solirubrobacterales bacterium]|nr:hypothetical protein [Solirubrobacterales bacterium]